MTALGWTPDFDSRGSLIFVEVARDAAEILKARGRRDLTKELLLRITVLHEVGHQFGLGDNTGGIMDQGMFDEMRAIFTSAHIKEIRKNTIPGGNRP
jgi:predicted Zn-dependent protease